MGILEQIKEQNEMLLDQNRAILSHLQSVSQADGKKIPGKMIKSREICERLGVSQKSFKTWKERLIPYGLRMREGRWRMLESDLEKYMNSKEIT